MMNIARTAIFLGLTWLALGCSASVQKAALDTALKDDQMRHETFEATLRVLDERPDYVPEFLETAVHHESSLEAIWTTPRGG